MDKKEAFLLARIEAACRKNYEPHYFDFADEAMQVKMEQVLKRCGEPYRFFGGMENACRKMLCIYPEYEDPEMLVWPMCALYFPKNFEVDHRNILGELMALGITRESLGDINVGEEGVQVIFHARLEDFLSMNFTKVKGQKIYPEVLRGEAIKTFELKFKRLVLVSASERLDGVINKIWGFSRKDSMDYIKQRRVRVNYQEVIKNDYRVKSGDIIALRGKGKAKIVSLDGVTKKGNLRLLVDKYV